MRPPGSMRAAMMVLAMLAGSASAGSPPPAERAGETPLSGSRGGPGAGEPGADRCTPAAIADVLLAAPVPVDEILVVVRDGSPASAAAEVTVAAERSDRVLRVRGGSHRLAFYPALTASSFRVSLLPSFEAGASPCVDRIELRRGGSAVATVVP